MKSLYVFFENEIVGQLYRDDDLVFSFEYSDRWITNPRSFALSLAMPLAPKKFGNKITLSFFENLLPEGGVKESIERHHNISGVFDFLAKYGKDCAGAIYLSEDPNDAISIDPHKMLQIDMKIIYKSIEDKASVADTIADYNPGYLSLAGAQDKFPIIFYDSKFFLPTQGAPTTHIVKVPIQHSGIKESVFNEYYCMELARRVGLEVPHCQVIPGSFPLFLVERYDRFRDQQGNMHRIHQQDFCQAHGLTSEYKYEEKGGPSIKQNYEMILKYIPVQKRLESIQILLDWVAFNLLIGNNDSHSKNISLLLKQQSLEIAPLYDLVCTAIYPKLKRSFSFEIGSQKDGTLLAPKNIVQFERDLGIKEGIFLNRFKVIYRKVMDNKDTLAMQICSEFTNAKIPLRISSLIGERAKSLRLQGLPIEPV